MAKIENDKYYSPQHIVDLVIQRTKEVIGLDNISEFIEPSAGNGAFLDKLYTLGKPVYAYDLYPEREDIKEQDFLKLNKEYVKGACVIGNFPFGDRNNLFRQFYNKSVNIGDYIVTISPIKMLNNTRQNYKFDLVHSEDLSFQNYSGIELHCCLNIYKRNPKGLNKKTMSKLKDIRIYREDEKAYNAILEDFKICRMGAKCGLILNPNQNLRNFKIVIKNKNMIKQIMNCLNYGWSNNLKNISTPYIAKDDIYKYLKEQIPELE